MAELTKTTETQDEELTKTKALFAEARERLEEVSLSEDSRQELDEYREICRHQMGRMASLEVRISQMQQAEGISNNIIADLKAQRDELSRQLADAEEKLKEAQSSEAELKNKLAQFAWQREERQQQLENTQKHCREQRASD